MQTDLSQCKQTVPVLSNLF